MLEHLVVRRRVQAISPPLDAYRGYTIQETELYLPWKMQYFQEIIKNKILYQS